VYVKLYLIQFGFSVGIVIFLDTLDKCIVWALLYSAELLIWVF